MKHSIWVIASSSFLFTACALLAQQPVDQPVSPGQTTADPPTRVARLNYLDGAVSFRPVSVPEWDWATLNAPLTNGDQLWTETDARAELHVGATAIHLAERTAFTLLKLDDHIAQMRLPQGGIYLRIPRMDEDQVYELDTPGGAAVLRTIGDYRFDVSEDGTSTLVSVRNGEAEVVAAGKTFTVKPGQMLRLSGIDQVEAELVEAAAPDPWEEWCLGRDRLTERSFEVSDAYVAPEMTGSEDLAQYGDWSSDADYGAVWCPRGVPVGWAPYRFGHWAYVAPWGWTWIDDAQWGFAPFHYGRWTKKQDRWLWIVGPRGVRPAYAPAVVAFVGSRGAGGRGIAGPKGNGHDVVAWVPLGPGERYVPPYRVSAPYLRALNGGRPGVAGGPATFVNRGSVTAVPQTVFVRAGQVSAQTVRLPQVLGGTVGPVNIDDIRPGRQSYLGRTSQPDGSAVSPPPAVIGRRVLGRDGRPAENPGSAVPARSQTAVGPSGRGAPASGSSSPTTSETIPEVLRKVEERARQKSADQQRADQERAEQQRAEQQGTDQQRRTEQRRADQQRAEQQRAAQQAADQQRQADQQRAEEQRAAQQRADQQRQVEQQRADQRRAEQQRADQQRADQQRADQQRAEQQRQEQRRAEQQRQAEQRAQQQRADQQRAEQQRADQQRAEQQRADQARADQQRQAEQRAQQQRAEQQRAEQQRQADDKKAAEDRKKQ